MGLELLAACLIGEVIDPEDSVGHGAVGNWWRLSGGRLSSILEAVSGVVIRKFFDVPDFSMSYQRYLVKGSQDGERLRREMGA